MVADLRDIVMSTCRPHLSPGWARFLIPNPDIGMNRSNVERLESSSFVVCQPRLLTAEFRVRVDSTGNILDAVQITDFDSNVDSYSTTNDPLSLLRQVNDRLAYPGNDNKRYNVTSTSDWLNSLLKVYLNSTDLVDPMVPLPDLNPIVPAVEEIYQRLTAVLLSINPQIFATAPSTATLDLDVSTVESRIFMSPLMFKISLPLLILQLIAAIFYYARRPKKFLPHMPITIASLMAYVAMSHPIESQPPHSLSSSSREEFYAFGTFIGVDGRPHVGIDKLSRMISLAGEDSQLSQDRDRARRKNDGIKVSPSKERSQAEHPRLSQGRSRRQSNDEEIGSSSLGERRPEVSRTDGDFKGPLSGWI